MQSLVLGGAAIGAKRFSPHGLSNPVVLCRPTRRVQFGHARAAQLRRARSKQVEEEQEEDEGEEWRVQRQKRPPPGVDQISSADFIRHIRDGGPQAIQSEGLPLVDSTWIGSSPEETARIVVNKLCHYRFGDGVCVDEVFAGPDSPRGTEYVISLTLADRMILGSCHSTQIQHFDRDTTCLLESLKELDGWNQPIYKLEVRTPGVEKDLKVPDDLWRCELFASHVTWSPGGEKRYNKHLTRVPNNSTLWRLADVNENYKPKKQTLDKQQQAKIYTIEEDWIQKVSLHMDSKSRNKLEKARKQVREAQSSGQESPDVVDILKGELTAEDDEDEEGWEYDDFAEDFEDGDEDEEVEQREEMVPNAPVLKDMG